VPYNQSELLEAALIKASVPVSFYTVKGGDHGGFDDPEIRQLVTEFLATHLLVRPQLGNKDAAQGKANNRRAAFVKVG